MNAHPIKPPRRLDAACKRLVLYRSSAWRKNLTAAAKKNIHELAKIADHIILLTDQKTVVDSQVRDLPGVTVCTYSEVIQAYRDGLTHAEEKLSDFDEVVFTDDSWFGGINSLDSVFARMGPKNIHFWTMTDHGGEFFLDRVAPVPPHYHSYWVAVRRELLESGIIHRWWESQASQEGDPQVRDIAFTEYLSQIQAQGATAFTSADFPSANPSIFHPGLMIENGFPFLRRGVLNAWPPFLDRHAVIGRSLLDTVESCGYSADLILEDLSLNVPPKDLNTNAALHEVLPEQQDSYDPENPLKIVAIAHIFYEEMTNEILDRVDTLPGEYDLIITTSEQQKAQKIKEILSRRTILRASMVDVRVVESNDGRDQSAFLIGCRDILLGDRYDLVVKVHSKKTPQDGFNVGRHFKQQQFTNLLNSAGYTANLVGLFQKNKHLGLAFPPTIHVGYPTLGRGWWSNKPGFAELCKRLDIGVPLDEITPLAPYGSMYFARPQALQILVKHPWKYEDFGGAENYQDGGLAHILERMPCYAAAELGYYTTTVTTAEYFAISHTTLEFNLDQASSTIPGYTIDQIQFLRRAGFVGEGSARDFLRMYLNLNARNRHSAITKLLEGTMNAKRKLKSTLRRQRN